MWNVMKSSYFKVPKTIRKNTIHYFIMKIPNKNEPQQIASNHKHLKKTLNFTKILLQNHFNFS